MFEHARFRLSMPPYRQSLQNQRSLMHKGGLLRIAIQKGKLSLSPKSFVLMAGGGLSFFLLSGVICSGQSAAILPSASVDTASCPAGTVNTAPADQPLQCSPAPGFTSPQQGSFSLLAPATAAAQQGANFQGGIAPAALAPFPSSTFAGPITNRSEFEHFAQDAAGQRLQVYGRQMFEHVPTTFAPLDHVPVPSDYVVGPGDQLLIRVWGKIDLNTSVTVDRNGQIFLPRIGSLMVAGLRFEQLASYLHAAIGNLYKGFDLNIAMGQLRSIQIFILGSARQPGVYTVSSLSTMIDALFASGGPSAHGSMRHIELRRGGRRITELDLYDLLRRGDKSKDAQLLPGDVIYIPLVGPQVAIVGSVEDPGIYELRGDCTVAAALRNAGGLSNLAETHRVLLERIENHRRRRVDEFPLDNNSSKRELQDGDVLRIFPISPQFENAVTLRGSVARPGRYLWREGMRISDLIPNREALLTRNYWIQQNFLGVGQNYVGSSESNPATSTNLLQLGGQNRSEPRGYQAYPPSNQGGNQNLLAADGDGAYANGARTAAGIPADYNGSSSANPNLPVDQDPPPSVTVERWNQPSRSPRVPHAGILAELDQNSEEIDWDYASVERLDDRDLSPHLIAFNLRKALDDDSSQDNLLLKAGDVVTIYTRRDIVLPQDKHAAFVRVDGEVNAPGVYRIHPGETLRGIVERAGGLTSHAYLYASQLTRVSTRLAEEEQLRLSINQMQRELMGRYAAAPSLAPVSSADQQAQLSAQQAMLAQLSAVHPTGRIVLDLSPRASAVADIPDFPLEDGDRFFIPPKLATVQVSGAVYNENAFRYEPGQHLSAYLSDAGGPTRQADKGHIFVIRADGRVIGAQSHDWFWHNKLESLALLPGDAIIVPTKMKSPTSFAQQLPFVTQILSQTALTGAVLGTTY